MSSSDKTTDTPVAKSNAKEDDTPATVKTESKVATNKKASKTSSPIFIVFIIVLLATSGGAYYYWMQFQTYLQKITHDTSILNNKYSETVTTLEQARVDLKDHLLQIKHLQEQIDLQNKQLKDVNASQKNLMSTAKKVFDITHRNQTKWLLSEVSYLLSLANQRLIVSRDIKSAIAALKAANNRLHDLSDPSLLKLRKQIASEVSQLNLLKLPDINGIAFGLDNITTTIEQLPFKSAQQKHIDNTKRSETVEIASLEQDSAFSPLWNRIKSLVTVKKHQRDVQPTETALQKTDIDSQLRYRIETSRLALINKNTSVFQHEMTSAYKLVSDYYDQQDNRVATLKTDLLAHSKINLVPELPDITGSWAALQQLIATNDAINSLKTKKGESIQ